MPTGEENEPGVVGAFCPLLGVYAFARGLICFVGVHGVLESVERSFRGAGVFSISQLCSLIE